MHSLNSGYDMPTDLFQNFLITFDVFGLVIQMLSNVVVVIFVNSCIDQWSSIIRKW